MPNLFYKCALLKKQHQTCRYFEGWFHSYQQNYCQMQNYILEDLNLPGFMNVPGEQGITVEEKIWMLQLVEKQTKSLCFQFCHFNHRILTKLIFVNRANYFIEKWPIFSSFHITIHTKVSHYYLKLVSTSTLYIFRFFERHFLIFAVLSGAVRLLPFGLIFFHFYFIWV